MNEIQIFKHEEFGKIRTIEIDGAIWFCGYDVCNALGYTNSRKTLKDHCKERGIIKCSVTSDASKQGVTSCDVTKRYVTSYDISKQGVTSRARKTQTMTFINEPNLYRLATQSKLEGAERFENWVFEEVLPTIRKTGGYGNTSLTPQQFTEIRIMLHESIESILSDREEEIADMIADKTIDKLFPFLKILNNNIIRKIDQNMKLLSIYIKWLIE
ncbi:MAG: hypothetical protein NC177_09785 [Ruminococcus flavefaciens]|nr:hypothetical protein [Ruminococcus flavefaciens]